jgi:hypothetical protein
LLFLLPVIHHLMSFHCGLGDHNIPILAPLLYLQPESSIYEHFASLIVSPLHPNSRHADRDHDHDHDRGRVTLRAHAALLDLFVVSVLCPHFH